MCVRGIHFASLFLLFFNQNLQLLRLCGIFIFFFKVLYIYYLHSLSRVVVPATYATQHLCQRSFYKIFVKFRNNKKNVLKIVLIIVNINKDENKSLISNQFSLKNDL